MDSMQSMSNSDNYSVYKIDFLKQLAVLLQEKVNDWYKRIAVQIKAH